MLILILILVFWKSKPYPFFGQICVEKPGFSTLSGSWYTEYLDDVIGRIQSKVWKKNKADQLY